MPQFVAPLGLVFTPIKHPGEGPRTGDMARGMWNGRLCWAPPDLPEAFINSDKRSGDYAAAENFLTEAVKKNAVEI